MKTLLPDLRVTLPRLVLVAAAAAGFSSPASASAAVLGTNGAATPTIAWGACDAGLLDYNPDFQCATVKVPLNYNKPTGTKIDLAISRLPATGPGTRLGSVFFNPGGPGDAGRAAPRFGTDKLRARFDLVGVDTRGTGLSNPAIRCAATSESAASLLNPAFPIPGNVTQESTAQNLASQGAAGCKSRNGEILTHLSSANSARDFELLRKSVGDAKFSFLGFSAASVIGQTYAQLFPSTTRAIALDSPIDPKKYLTGNSSSEGQQPIDYRMKSYLGTDQGVTSFLQACAANPATCAYVDATANTATKLRTKFNATLARVKANNGVVIDLGDGNVTLTYQDVIGMVFGDLQFGIFTSQDIASYLQAIDIASKSAHASIPSTDLQAFIEAYARLRHFNDPVDQTQPYDNFIDSFNSILCSETDHPGSSAYTTFGRTANNEVAGFGPFWTATTIACGYWTPKDTDRYTGPWTARPTTPILITSNKLGDVAAPYANAQSSATLTGARIVGVNEYGHTTYTLASQCVNDTIDDYLIGLVVPPVGKTCDTDFGPFDPIEEEVAAEGLATGYSRLR